MVQMHPKVREQLKRLRKISYGSVKHLSAGVVEIPLGQMKSHDLARALYVSANSFAELLYKQQMISKVIHKVQADIKEVLDDNTLTKEQLIEKIKEITLDSDKAESLSKPFPSEGKES